MKKTCYMIFVLILLLINSISVIAATDSKTAVENGSSAYLSLNNGTLLKKCIDDTGKNMSDILKEDEIIPWYNFVEKQILSDDLTDFAACLSPSTEFIINSSEGAYHVFYSEDYIDVICDREPREDYYFDYDMIDKKLYDAGVSDIKCFVGFEAIGYCLYIDADNGSYIMSDKDKSWKMADGSVVSVEKYKLYTTDEFVKLYNASYQRFHVSTHTGANIIDTGDEVIENTAMPNKEVNEASELISTSSQTAMTPATSELAFSAEQIPAPTPVPKIIVYNMRNGLTITVKGEQVLFTDTKPFIDESNRTQVPVRAVSESIGLTVEYDDIAKEVSISGKDTEVLLTIGSQDMIVNGEMVKMDTAARIVNDRTYIPIRFVAEALGFDVEWK